MNKVAESFGERLKALRLARGMSQKDVAARVESSPGSAGNWEAGPTIPHPKTLRKLAALFETEVGFLLTGRLPPASARRGAETRPPTEADWREFCAALGRLKEAVEAMDRITQRIRPEGGTSMTTLDRVKEAAVGAAMEKFYHQKPGRPPAK